MNPHIAKVMVDDGIAGVMVLIVQQRRRENTIGGEAEGWCWFWCHQWRREQVADGEMAKAKGRV